MRMRHLLKNLSQKRCVGGVNRFLLLSIALLGLSLSCSTPSLNPHKPSHSSGVDSSPLGTDEDPSSTIKGWWLYNTSRYGAVALHITDTSVNDNADSYLKKFDKAIECMSPTLKNIDTYKYRLYEFHETTGAKKLGVVINYPDGYNIDGWSQHYVFDYNTNIIRSRDSSIKVGGKAYPAYPDIIRDPSWQSAEDACGPQSNIGGWWRYTSSSGSVYLIYLNPIDPSNRRAFPCPSGGSNFPEYNIDPTTFAVTIEDVSPPASFTLVPVSPPVFENDDPNSKSSLTRTLPGHCSP